MEKDVGAMGTDEPDMQMSSRMAATGLLSWPLLNTPGGCPPGTAWHALPSAGSTARDLRNFGLGCDLHQSHIISENMSFL